MISRQQGDHDCAFRPEKQNRIFCFLPEPQSNNSAWGGARTCGNRPVPAEATFSFRWVSIFSMTTGSRMRAITLTPPPHALHCDFSGISRCTRVMAARCLTGIFSCPSSYAQNLLPLPLLAGVINARCSLLEGKNAMEPDVQHLEPNNETVTRIRRLPVPLR